ncbi:MAG: hypothetical protein U1F35_17490 [Steroidobacteraceae bacterium]
MKIVFAGPALVANIRSALLGTRVKLPPGYSQSSFAERIFDRPASVCLGLMIDTAMRPAMAITAIEAARP